MRNLLPIALALLAGCGPSGKPFHYPQDGEMRIQHLQVKATHNSYHLETPGNNIPDWHYTHAALNAQLDRQGVRSLELDVHWEASTRFEVYHIAAADERSSCRALTDCLRVILDWSNRYPGHHPIYVQLEPKTGFRGSPPEVYFAALEREILSVWPRERIITPGQIKGAAPSLREAVRDRGWPTLGTARGKILLAFNDTGEVRAAYTHGGADLDGRLIFVESDPADPFAAIAILNDPVRDSAKIGAALAANLLVRTMGDGDLAKLQAGDHSTADAALASGAHFISTDHPVPGADLAYALNIPGGAPSRCNPITAPAGCTARAIEDPAFVGSEAP
ncbi:MAG: hypothetical protein EXR72_15480 [Myxococcales bacterium]|nr:hypothetical protein [Myxococcales bacterium]